MSPYETAAALRNKYDGARYNTVDTRMQLESWVLPVTKDLIAGRDYHSRFPYASQAHSAYVGPLTHLYGKMAILTSHHPYKDNGARRGFVFAQFDDTQARRRGDRLGFRWHKFRETEFKLPESA